MNYHIQSAMFDHIQAGESHNLSNFLPITRCVAVSCTFLAHWLGVIRTQKEFGYAVTEQLTAVIAQQ